MRIINDRALLLRVRNPNQITASIPKSKKVSNNEVLVHWGLDEVRVLKNLNIRNIPSPIEKRYDWGGIYKPFAHQKTTAAFLTVNRRAFCFNEQGTGKTASAIWAADYLMKLGVIKRVLVVCPLSIMDSAWRADLFSFAMHRTVAVAHGARDRRKAIASGDSEFMIVNYDGVEVIYDEIANGGFDLIVVDECNHYKNQKSKRWKILNSLLRPDTWLWMMTGTPAAQSPLDAYGLAKLVNPTGVPKFFGAFRDKVMYKITRFKWVPKPEATDVVFDALQPAIRFTKDECMDLPDMVYIRRDVGLGKMQRAFYNDIKKRLRAEADETQVTAANAAVAINKLLQISGGAVYEDGGDTIQFDISSRFTALTEVIEESSKKVLVFIPFRHTIEILSEKLQEHGVSTEVIHGGVPATARTEIFAKFQQEPDPRILLIQPAAAAHGVTLTAANTIVWWGPVWSLETYMQANARVHRSGQTHKCTVVHLIGSDAERKVYGMLENRINSHTEVVDLYKEIIA